MTMNRESLDLNPFQPDVISILTEVLILNKDFFGLENFVTQIESFYDDLSVKLTYDKLQENHLSLTVASLYHKLALPLTKVSFANL
jgi:hypothetical protein